MTHPSEADAQSRLEGIQQALSGLSPQQLAQAAAAVPPPLGDILRALAAGDLATVLGNLKPDAALQGDVDQAAAALGPLLSQLRAQSDAVTQAADRIASEADAVTAQGREIVDALPEDHHLHGLLQRAVGLLERNELTEAINAVLHEAGGVADAAARTVAQPDESRLSETISRLEAHTGTLERTADEARALLPALLEAVAARSSSREAAEAALVHAGLTNTTAAWQAALDAALRAEHLSAASLAGQRLQLGALRGGQPDAAAKVAMSVGGLAWNIGNGRQGVLSGLEVASHLASAGRKRMALDALRGVLDRAEREVPTMVPRAHLDASRILLTLGQTSDARRGWRRLLRRDDLDPGIRARAELYLGRLHADGGAPDKGLPLLESAHSFGVTQRAAMLYAPALIALMKIAIDRGDRDRAGSLLREARQLAPTMGGGGAVSAVQRLTAFLREQWGDDAVAAMLAGDA